jgi:tetratricopeptide (TPR) repeat protein
MPGSPEGWARAVSEVSSALRHMIEEVRLLLERDPIAGFLRWSGLHTELAQRGYFEVCDELMAMISGLGSEFPKYGRGILRYGEGWSADRAGQWREAIDAYRDALRSFEQAGLDLRCQILCQIGSLYQDQGHLNQAHDEYQLALAAAANDHDRALLLHNLGGLASLRNDVASARGYLEQAKATFDQTDDRYNYAAACVGLGGVLRDEGRLQDSVYQLVEAIRGFEELGNIKGMATAIAALALTYYTAGEFEVSFTTYRTALDLLVSVKDRGGIAKTLSNMGLVKAAEGAINESLTFFEQALAEYRDIGDLHGQAIAESNIRQLDDADAGD